MTSPPFQRPHGQGGQQEGRGRAPAPSVAAGRSAVNDPLSRILARLEELGCRPKGRNGSWTALCPGHHDRRPSLSVTEAEDGLLLLRCHAGCATESILERLGLTWAALFPGSHGNGHRQERPQEQPQQADPLSWWAERCGVPLDWLRRLPLRRERGAVAFAWPGLEVIKLRSPDRKGYWLGDGPRPPLWPALPEKAPPVLVLTEGESDATVALYLLEAAGLQEKATAAGVTKGASTRPEPGLLRELAAKGVEALLLVPDADVAGESWARSWAEAGQAVGLSASTLDLVALGLVSPSLGETDLRDAYRRHRQRLTASLGEAANRFIRYKSGSLDESKSCGSFLSAAALVADPQSTTTWLWRGYIPVGGVTLLSAWAKDGKTTLVAHLLQALFSGQSHFLGQPLALPREAKVAILSEESRGKVADRLRALNLSSERLLVTFRHHAGHRSLRELVQEAVALGAALVVVDTVASWAAIEEENSASDVEAALRPCINICQQAGASLLLVHHLRKSGGGEGRGHRGSGHVVAVADVAVELVRPDGNAPHNRRILRATSRFDETPAELVAELRPEGYVALGTSQQVLRQELQRAILDALPGPGDEPIPFEAKEGDCLMARLRERGRWPRSTTHEVLARLVGEGAVERQGSGKRGDPFRYRLAGRESFHPDPQPYNGGNDSRPPAGPGGEAEADGSGPRGEGPSPDGPEDGGLTVPPDDGASEVPTTSSSGGAGPPPPIRLADYAHQLLDELYGLAWPRALREAAICAWREWGLKCPRCRSPDVGLVIEGPEAGRVVCLSCRRSFQQPLPWPPPTGPGGADGHDPRRCRRCRPSPTLSLEVEP